MGGREVKCGSRPDPSSLSGTMDKESLIMTAACSDHHPLAPSASSFLEGGPFFRNEDGKASARFRSASATHFCLLPPPSGGIPTLGPPCPQGEAVAVQSQAASPRGPGHPQEELSKLVNCAGVQHNPTPFPLSSNNNLHEPSLHQILVGQELSPTS